MTRKEKILLGILAAAIALAVISVGAWYLEFKKTDVPPYINIPFYDFGSGTLSLPTPTPGGSSVPPAASGTLPSANGIYSMLKQGDSLNGTSKREVQSHQAFMNPYVTGVYLRDVWSDVEPSKGTYDWSYLDSQVAIAAADHKKVEMDVQAGIFTPSWVYDQDHAQKFITTTVESADENFCQPNKALPVPWDPAFLADYTAFVQAFGAHFANNPNVVMVKVAGINITTSETVAPQEDGTVISVANSGQGNGRASCQTNNDISEWIADGYTGQKVLTAWETIARAYASAFPNQHLGIMTSVHSFPPIAFNSSTQDPAGASLSIDYFLPAGRQIFGNRFIVAQNGARGEHLDPGTWAFATSTDTELGWQPSWPINSCYDATGKLVHTQNFAAPCTLDTVIEQLINTELNSHPNYLEFMSVQLDDTDSAVQASLKQAYDQITGQS